jgi:2-polyprenyl-3-methyl-5-hydroxy-6-metoxy-1,4-benzoquinol methylase
MSDRQIIDVERLVDELKERVSRERAGGAYRDDFSEVELEVLPPQGDGLAQGFDLQPGQTRVRFRPELGFSSKPVIGYPITLVKKLILRLIFFVMDDLARQTDAAVARLESAIAAEATARESAAESLQAAAGSLQDAIQAESASREAVAVDVHGLSQRLDKLAESLDHLQLNPRLARLERAVRARGTQQPAKAGELPPVPSGASFDYLAFEARFRPEESVVERQRAYVEELRSERRVVDLGAGRGELVKLLTEAGVSAYAVEIERDFVELMRDEGIEVVDQDAIAHLRGLDDGQLGGIVVSHVVEHLPAPAVSELVALAADKLAPGGVLIMETPNPESVVAGSVNFHRDLTHVRPIHPDTLAFLCESEGFSKVEIRRLSPVPDEERLPTTGDEKIDEVIGQLNDLIYGFQDYAIVARKGTNQPAGGTPPPRDR